MLRQVLCTTGLVLYSFTDLWVSEYGWQSFAAELRMYSQLSSHVPYIAGSAL